MELDFTQSIISKQIECNHTMEIYDEVSDEIASNISKREDIESMMSDDLTDDDGNVYVNVSYVVHKDHSIIDSDVFIDIDTAKRFVETRVDTFSDMDISSDYSSECPSSMIPEFILNGDVFNDSELDHDIVGGWVRKDQFNVDYKNNELAEYGYAYYYLHEQEADLIGIIKRRVLN